MEVLELAESRTALKGEAANLLESGGVVLLPSRPFVLEEAERSFLDPALLTRSKNVSFDPATGALGGVRGAAATKDSHAGVSLRAMMRRFSSQAEALVAELAPEYRQNLQMRRTSFRPGAVAERALSPRKDDRRLHIDAFPANPVQGRRILRVFANVNPIGEARLWDIGEESFETFAIRFKDRLRIKGSSGRLMQRLGLTRGRRSAYDQAMLQLHDLAKLDNDYQASAPKRRLAFPAGSMWAVYTDAVQHAALAGQHAFEQTFLLPVEVMMDPTRAPLDILERMTGRSLV